MEPMQCLEASLHEEPLFLWAKGVRSYWFGEFGVWAQRIRLLRLSRVQHVRFGGLLFCPHVWGSSEQGSKITNCRRSRVWWRHRSANSGHCLVCSISHHASVCVFLPMHLVALRRSSLSVFLYVWRYLWDYSLSLSITITITITIAITITIVINLILIIIIIIINYCPQSSSSSAATSSSST